MKRSLLVVLVLAALLLPVSRVYAQRLTGSASIEILDPDGKSVPDAKVTVANADKGVKLALASKADGSLVIPDLAPGEYKLTIEHDGFRTTTTTLTIRIGVSASLSIKMELGAVASTVLVESSTETVDTATSTVQGVIQSNQIESLPLNGRNFLDLAQLAPGVQIVDGGLFDPTKNQMVGVSVAGRSGRSTRIQVDGVDITDETVGTTVMNLTNESVQEFGISQSSLDVSTDLTSSGAVNIITKGGGNTIHGSGFGLWRRSAFAASNAPLTQSNPPKPVFSRDNYGGRLGGYLVKDKWFWEAEYERLNQAGQNTTSVVPFPQFTGSFGVPVGEHMGGIRSDFNLTSNQKLFYRYTHDDNIGVTGFGGVGLSAFANSNNANSHLVGWDYTKGTWVHSIRFSFMKFANGIVDGNALAGTPVAVDPAGDIAQINLRGLGGFVYGPSADAPQSTYQQDRQIKYDGSKLSGRHTFKFGVEYNRIDQAGYASFFGLGPRAQGSYSSGVATDLFSAAGASDPLNYKFTGAYFGNDLGFGSELPSLGFPYGGFHNNRYGVYGHDTWKITRTLTINGGLRYDYDTGLTNSDLQRNALIGAFNPALGGYPKNDAKRFAPQVGFAWSLGKDGKTVIRGGGGIYYETNIFNNILFDRTLNLVPGLGNSTPNITSGLPQLLSPVDQSVLFDINTSCTGAQPSSATPNSCLGAAIGKVLPFIVAAQKVYQQASKSLSASWPTPGVPVEFASDLGTDTIGGSLINPNYKSPYGAQVNIGVQRQLKPGLLFSVDYIMNRGVHSLVQTDWNRIGAANTLNVGAAQTAMNKTFTADGCNAGSNAANIACVIAGGGSIEDFVGQGLGAGSGLDGFAFSGVNPNYRVMDVLSPYGLSRYQGLQFALTGKLGTLGPMKNITTNVTYAYSSFKGTGGTDGNTDQDFITLAQNNDNPTAFYGYSNLDRRHQLGVSFIFDLPAGFKFSTTNWYRSPESSDISLFDSTSGGADRIFFTDLNGDGVAGDPLPGTNHGSFGRGVDAAGLNAVINNYNNTVAGTLTPAAKALVTAGLFTQAQLVALGAVADTVTPAHSTQINNPNFYTTDIRLSWQYKLSKEHPITIEPMVECFNLFNRMNGVGNSTIGNGGNTALAGTLSGATGTINGTDRIVQRVGAGSGSFSSGVPRAFQFGIRVSF